MTKLSRQAADPIAPMPTGCPSSSRALTPGEATNTRHGSRTVASSVAMPISENADGTLWIDISEMAEVEEVQSKLMALKVPVAAVIQDPAGEVIVKAVRWSHTYPKIVPRNGPEPGIVVNPAQVPDGHALLLTVHTLCGGGLDGETATVLHLIQGGPPSRVAEIIGYPAPPPPPPGFRLADAPSAR